MSRAAPKRAPCSRIGQATPDHKGAGLRTAAVAANSVERYSQRSRLLRAGSRPSRPQGTASQFDPNRTSTSKIGHIKWQNDRPNRQGSRQARRFRRHRQERRPAGAAVPGKPGVQSRWAVALCDQFGPRFATGRLARCSSDRFPVDRSGQELHGLEAQHKFQAAGARALRPSWSGGRVPAECRAGKQFSVRFSFRWRNFRRHLVGLTPLRRRRSRRSMRRSPS